ncbi:hypothetical protein N9103_00480, partial [Akkermansiaceae bacterium]|nr:hypothetical protein [Akkermansiaceae bacterium]
VSILKQRPPSGWRSFYLDSIHLKLEESLLNFTKIKANNSTNSYERYHSCRFPIGNGANANSVMLCQLFWADLSLFFYVRLGHAF